MKLKHLYMPALVLAMGTAFTACEDLLDTENLSTDSLDNVLSNATDARKMVDHVYAYFCEDSYTSRMSTNWMQNTDVEIASINMAQTVGNDRRAVWCLNPSYFGDIRTAWDHNYAAIDFANQIITGMEKQPNFQNGDPDYLQIYGEAKCLRAYRYFLLCNFWGDVPFATEPTSSENLNDGGRVDKNKIYSYLIQDLINCEEGMQWADKITTEYMNREFALGFIVKLAMFRAGYSMQEDGTMDRCRISNEIDPVTYKDENGVEKTAQSNDDFYYVAQAYARKLINLKGRALSTDFKGIFDAQINGFSAADGDVLYEVAYIKNSGGDIGWCHGLSVVKGTWGSGTTYTNMAAPYAVSFDPEDQRFPVTCAMYRWDDDNIQTAKNGWAIEPAKWCRRDLDATDVESKGTGINDPLLRYADVLLLLAEADNEIGNGPTAEAKEMLRTVRARAFAKSPNAAEKVDAYVNSLSTYEEFKDAIRKERAWEFGGERIRKFDLIRWNYYSDAIVNTLESMREMAMNSLQLELNGDHFVQKKDQIEIADKGFASKLYYTVTDGRVEFLNDIWTQVDDSNEPYASAKSFASTDVKNNFTSTDTYRVNFAEQFGETKKDATGADLKDEDGNKLYIMTEGTRACFYGFTTKLNGTWNTGTENISTLRGKPVPYVMPIPTDRIITSNGVLNNNGYLILNP